MARLDHDEDHEQREGRAQEAEGSPGGPADLVALHDGVDGEDQRPSHGDSAADVEPPFPGRRLHGRAEVDGEHEDRDADRNVDEKDPVPAQKVREDPAEKHTGSPASREHEADDAHGFRPFGRLGEHDHDQREDDDRDDRAAEALDCASRDEKRLGGSKSARERGRREDRDPDEEEAPVPVEVTETATQKQEAAEREQVRVHDPGQGGLREAEIVPNRRQGDVHDRAVEDDHDVAETKHIQR
jgi:hypothetical protein